jgi:hypothetical protein
MGEDRLNPGGAVLPVLYQHAEEAAFLWLLRSDAVSQPHYLLSDLAKLDTRVSAHLDGLKVGGEPAWKIAQEELKRGGAGEAFVIAALSLDARDWNTFRPLIADGPSEVRRALISAIG